MPFCVILKYIGFPHFFIPYPIDPVMANDNNGASTEGFLIFFSRFNPRGFRSDFNEKITIIPILDHVGSLDKARLNLFSEGYLLGMTPRNL